MFPLAFGLILGEIFSVDNPLIIKVLVLFPYSNTKCFYFHFVLVFLVILFIYYINSCNKKI